MKVVLLTARPDSDALAAAVVSGASTYLVKELRGADIAHTVRAAAGPQRQLDAGVVDAVVRVLGTVLSDDERGLLVLLAEGRTDVEIALDRAIDEVTAATLVDALFAKLGVGRRPAPSSGASLSRR